MPLTVHDFGGGTVSLMGSWPDSTWNAINPSIVQHDGKLLCFVRLIEGSVDDNERYTLYRNYESRIGMVELNEYTYNVIPGSHRVLDVKGADALKIEDVRGFSRDGRLYLAGALLRHNDDLTWFGNRMVELEVVGDVAMFVRELPARWEGSREKNWTVPVWAAPFEYVVDLSRTFVNGEILVNPSSEVESPLHGGTQAVPIIVDGRRHWLTIMHRQLMLDDDDQSWKYHFNEEPGRQYAFYSMLYLHHVVILDDDGWVARIGRPFIFDRPSTEFAAGIVDLGNTLLVSYGSMDRESRLAILPKWRLLDHGFPYTGLAWEA